MSQPASGGPPPLPPLPPQAPRPAAFATPPQPRNRGCLIAAVVAAGLLLPVVAILAAIAIPAYNDYVARSKVAQALAETAPLKLQAEAFIAQEGRCPDNGSAGFSAADGYRGIAHASIAIGETGEGRCALEILLHDERSDAIDGRRLWLEYDSEGGSWHCSSDAEDRYLPADCRG
ncbi:MAG TPA: pilin [Luteimonas sp.]|nr:pilin [Luteimonas sp.]HRP72891.1 pilin [Luteimonas sp.]